jgi:hypothetical protein
MDQSTKDAGTIAALMIRMREYRLPRAKRMLRRVYNDSRNTQPLVKRHPEYHDLIVRAIDLYTEIIAKGLENEKRE